MDDGEDRYGVLVVRELYDNGDSEVICLPAAGWTLHEFMEEMFHIEDSISPNRYNEILAYYPTMHNADVGALDLSVYEGTYDAKA